MKCPDCGDTQDQIRLGPADAPAEHSGYRCPRCGRLYAVPTEIANLTQRLADMKATLHAQGLRMGELGRQIAASEAELLELRERLARGEA
jgi:transposase-like protein